MLGPEEERGLPAASPLPSSHVNLLQACLAKYSSEVVQRLADVEGAVETLERALRSTRACEGSDDSSVATIALRIVSVCRSVGVAVAKACGRAQGRRFDLRS